MTEAQILAFKALMRTCMDNLFCARFMVDTSPIAALSSVDWVIGVLTGAVETMQEKCISKGEGEKG